MYLLSETTHRYIFVEFKNADDAAYAMAALNGHPFDAKHTFFVNRFTDIERFAELDETWVEPEPEPYKAKVRRSGKAWHDNTDGAQEHLRAWLGDPQGRDQYATYRGEEVEVHWHGKPSQCEVAHKRNVSPGIPSCYLSLTRSVCLSL